MKKFQIGSLFPNTNTTVAYYSSTSFCITLNTISSSQMKQIKHNELGFTETKKILYHEIRHHIDHLSSLWGQARIIALYDAINSKFSMDEKEFYKMTSYKIEEKQFHYYDYYTDVKGAATYDTPLDRWEWRITCGTRFNHRGEIQLDKLILFTRFTDQYRLLSIRAPMTIACLLETNAIFEETIIEQEMLLNIEEKNRSKAKDGNLRKMMKNVLYNQEMVEYNCAVHLVANVFGIGDPYKAYEIASSIATLTMNLPASVTNSIPVDDAYMEVWGDRVTYFIKNHDYGFLYFNMVNNYKESYKSTGLFDLNSFLEINKLPDRETLEAMVVLQMKKNLEALTEPKYFTTFFYEQVKAGIELFCMRGIDGKKVSLKNTILSGKYAPFIVNSDTAFIGKHDFISVLKAEEIMQNIDMTDWYHLAKDLNDKMDEFYRVCGI